MNLSELSLQLHSLTVFRSLLQNPVLAALIRYIDLPETSPLTCRIDAYCTFVAVLYQTDEADWFTYVQRLALDDENVYIQIAGSGKQPPAYLQQALQAELVILQRVASLTPEQLRSPLSYDGYLPDFSAGSGDLLKAYAYRAANVGRYGYGMYARYSMFYVSEDSRIVPVQNPDPISLNQLIEYKRERQLIINNTRALLSGKPAANILLTGDAGTGKSSTIKAVVNDLREEGLRIVEVRKDQLRYLPVLLDALTKNPLKFILFIDDLSFQKNDDDFSALKAVLEGSVSYKSSNVVIYATSNRRHLVKETFDDREGNDIHRNDTMQEILSLSDRFGLQITFQRPDKETYLSIVGHLARQAGIQKPQAELELAAERFALQRGNRSARAARQFVDLLIADETIL